MSGPVERLLARTPAEHLVGAIQPSFGGDLPWSFTYGARAKRYSLTMVLITLVGILVVSAAAVMLALGNGWDPQRMMALSLVAYLVLSMTVPKLLGRKKRGAGWERQVMIDKDFVRVIDRYGDTSTQWRQPLKTYRDLHYRAVSVGGKTFASAPAALDLIELRHRNPGRCIYLQGRPRPGATARPTLAEMIKAGRKRERASVRLPLLDGADGEQFEQLISQLSEALEVPVTHDRAPTDTTVPPTSALRQHLH